MNKYTFTHKGKTYTRINKTKARKQFLQGDTVYLLPCNLRFDCPWYSAFPVSMEEQKVYAIDETGIKNRFESLINSFEYYNCNNSEIGKYCAFYIERKEV